MRKRKITAAMKNWIIIPYKFQCLKKYSDAQSELKILDVGCGNGSPTATKIFFPNCHYSGLDHTRYNQSEADDVNMDVFYDADLNCIDSLQQVPDAKFDVIICSHVIEHIVNGLDVVAALTAKLKPGGMIYLEYPSVRSIGLPRMRGTLRFSDDDTHCQLYTTESVCNALMNNCCTVLDGGRRRFIRRILLMPLVIVKNWHAPAGAFWDLLGFADFVVAKKDRSL